MSSPIAGLGSLGGISPLPKLPPLEPSDSEGGFGGVLKNALQQVNQLNGGAEQQIGSLLKGGNSDMSSVMIAVEKADVAFQLMMQVRNKIVNAYQDIEKMQF
jgi:flagellar hook-basal body complex protein FliE